MAAKDNAYKAINRISETHYFLKLAIVSRLKDFRIPYGIKHLANNKSTYYEYWTESFGDRFYDIGTLVRLGSEIEGGLKYYYMEKKGLSNLVDLKNDPRYEMNIFQRLMPWTQKNAIALFQDCLHYDLTSNTNFSKIQELMLLRHLYAHNNGLLNEKFLDDFKRLTGQDIESTLDPNLNYPQQDTYYFKPLKNLNEYIEAAKKFFTNLP